MNIIDIDKLENIRTTSGGVISCACPACRADNRDSKGEHLRVWPNMAFNCVVDNSKEHNKQILAIAGTEASPEKLLEIELAQSKQAIRLPKKREWPISILDGLINDNSYWKKRGISVFTCEYFKMGVAVKGHMINRNVLPIFNLSRTKIIGFSGRALKPNMEPKYKHIGDKMKWIFPANSEEIKRTKKVILVESHADVLYLWDMGIKNTHCLFGTVLSSNSISYIVSLAPQEILISTNNEDSKIGNNSALSIMDTLLQVFNESSIKIALPIKKDFNEMTIEEIQQWRSKYGC